MRPAEAVALRQLLTYSGYLSTGNPDLLDGLPGAFKDAVTKQKLLEDANVCCSGALAGEWGDVLQQYNIDASAVDSRTAEAAALHRAVVQPTAEDLLEEFHLLNSPGTPSSMECATVEYYEFIETFRAAILAPYVRVISERSAWSGLLLFARYLKASLIARRLRDVGCADVRWDYQRTLDFNLLQVLTFCTYTAVNMFDGKISSRLSFIDPGHVYVLMPHVMMALEYDVAEGSPMDYVGAVELLNPNDQFCFDAGKSACFPLRALYAHPIVLSEGRPSSLAAVAIAMTVFLNLPIESEHREQTSRWIEENWKARDSALLSHLILLGNHNQLDLWGTPMIHVGHYSGSE